MARAKREAELELLRCTESYVTAVEDAHGRVVDVFVKRGDLVAADDPAARPMYLVPADATAAEERLHRQAHGLFQHH